MHHLTHPQLPIQNSKEAAQGLSSGQGLSPGKERVADSQERLTDSLSPKQSCTELPIICSAA